MTDKQDETRTSGTEEGNATEESRGRGPATQPQGSGGAGAQGLAIAALVLSIIALVGMLVGGWWGWQRYQAFAEGQGDLVDASELAARSEALSERIAELRGRVTSLDERNAGRDQQIAGLEESIDTLRQQQSDLTARMDRVTELAQVSRDDWRRSEAAYLANVAVHRARYYQDADAALGALREADRLLAALGGEGIGERKAIREAIDLLLDADVPKVARTAEEIGEIADAVDGYRLHAGAQPLSDEEAAGPDSWGAEEAVSGAFGDAWEQFRGAMGELVVVSGPEREVVPLRPIEERYFLRENLRLRLEGARLAALQGDTSTYRDGLERAREWLQRYYDSGDPAVAEAVDRLAALAERPVTVDLPEIESVLGPVREFD
ncbi:uroporphyrinogen-III C-methyltransferase [Arhodomonas sp. SL1]|uniref:uroporphyrinogen-III C-methyltransferase n=1 Tax=Arhodomonas sp. SL1 TaxID=3425691 RepID=UPI003F88037A